MSVVSLPIRRRRLRIRPYEGGDEARVSPRADFARAFLANGRRLPEGPKVTLFDGPQILAVGGLEPLGGRTWGGWLYAADLTPRQWFKAASYAFAYLQAHWRIFEPRLVQAVPEPTRPAAARLLARLGFRPSDADPDIFILTGSP